MSGTCSEIPEDLVSLEHVSERLNLGMAKEPARVGSKSVRRVGEAESGREADERGVQGTDGPPSHPRSIHGFAARDESGSLYEVVTLFEGADETRDGINTIFSVAVDGDDAVVRLSQSVPEPDAQLCAQSPFRAIDEQCPNAALSKTRQSYRAIGAAAVGDDDVRDPGDVAHALELIQDAGTFVEYGDEYAYGTGALGQLVCLTGRKLTKRGV